MANDTLGAGSGKVVNQHGNINPIVDSGLKLRGLPAVCLAGLPGVIRGRVGLVRVL